MKFSKKIYNLTLYTFAIIGFILITGYVASKSNLTKNSGVAKEESDYFNYSRKLSDNKNYIWLNTEEYLILKEAMRGEQSALVRIESETGIKPRLLISILFVEQMRLYNSNRELFKKVFEPLKILGVQSQFSWGVLGLKQETLIQVENNASSSPLLAFSHSTEASPREKDRERFNRVINEHNHYYTYLYAALFIKQIEEQWRQAGFDISDKPEILATLYNIGFANSKPNSDPKVGGAEIDIANIKYTFGRLAYEFYYSNELIDIYPR